MSDDRPIVRCRECRRLCRSYLPPFKPYRCIRCAGWTPQQTRDFWMQHARKL